MDFVSMDETALLALGILLEEMAEHVLGDTGDLAFVEGEQIEEEVGDDRSHDNAKGKGREMLEPSTAASGATTPARGSDVESRRTAKRRKIKHANDDT